MPHTNGSAAGHQLARGHLLRHKLMQQTWITTCALAVRGSRGPVARVEVSGQAGQRSRIDGAEAQTPLGKQAPGCRLIE